MARFFFDHDFPQGVSHHLRRYGHDVVTARSTNRERKRDDDQLLYAALERRTALTHNRRDFILLNDAWHRWSGSWSVQPVHSGILVMHQGWQHLRYAITIEELLRQQVDIANKLYQCDARGGWAEVFAAP